VIDFTEKMLRNPFHKLISLNYMYEGEIKMSNLASFSAINQRVIHLLEDESVENIGLAFEKLCLRLLLKTNDDEIEEAITDGPMDGELDAVYIIDNIVHLLTFKYTEDFNSSKRNYPETELDQFILTIDSIINGTLNKATINDAIWEKFQEIKDLPNKGKIEFRIYVVSNKEYPAPHARKKLESVIDKYRIVDKPIYLNQEDLVLKIIENKTTKVDGQIRLIEHQHFEKSSGNIKTVIGAIAAKDFVELIKDPNDPNSVNEQIFNENVRIYKPKHRVNKAIIETAVGPENYQFFYLNNGITILCDKVHYAPFTRDPILNLVNFQIINGGQTSHSIFEVNKQDPDKLETIEILLRVCEADSKDPISQKICETSNSQIPVGNRDLHSNDLIQQKLQEEFEALGYFYERKPNQHSNIPKRKVINNELLGQLFMAYHLDMPSEAKNNKAKVFSDLYDSIFNEDIINAAELLRLYKLYIPLLDMKKDIQRKKRRKDPVNEKEAFISRATFHILNGIKYQFLKEENLINQEEISDKERNRKKQELFETKATEFTEVSINLIYEVVIKEMSERGDLYTHDKFFKEIQTNEIIRNHIKRTICF